MQSQKCAISIHKEKRKWRSLGERGARRKMVRRKMVFTFPPSLIKISSFGIIEKEE
jgi:hypothetical protein